MTVPSTINIKRSLFLKISLLLFFAVSIMTTGLFLIEEKEMESEIVPVISDLMVRHAQGIVAGLGSQPEVNQLQQIADSLQVEIWYESDGVAWQSDPDMQVKDRAAMKPYKDDERIRVMNSDEGDELFVDLDLEHGHYQFNFLKAEFLDQDEIYFLTSLGLVVFSFFIIYLLLRSQLKPIKALHEGVREIGEGNLDFEIETNRVDELGQLALSFNRMTQRIRKSLLARDQLLLDVSHELRSPLTRMLVAIEFLENNKTKQTLYKNIKNMESMVTEILENERMNSPHGGLQTESINILDLLMDLCKNHQGQEPGVVLQCSPEDLIVTVDPTRVTTVLNNLLLNAIRHSNATDPIEVSCTRERDKILIKVQDYGSGIPQDDLPHIFEPFYRVDKSRSKQTGGYGLGMSVCKKIMEAHGGQIDISSSPNKGTCVLLTFPMR